MQVEPWAVQRGGWSHDLSNFSRGPDFYFVNFQQILYGFSISRCHELNGAVSFSIRGLQFLSLFNFGGIRSSFWCWFTFIIFPSNENRASPLIRAGPRDVVPLGWTPISILCLLCLTFYSSLPLLFCTCNVMVKCKLNMYFFNESQGKDFWDQPWTSIYTLLNQGLNIQQPISLNVVFGVSWHTRR